MKGFAIGIPIYPDVDLIDVTATWDILSRIPHYWPGSIDLNLVARSLSPVKSGQGMTLNPTRTFNDCPPLDVILVPGSHNTDAALKEPGYLDFVRARGEQARYVVSVCTGSIILAAAGLLKGLHATSYWRSIARLETFEGVIAANGFPRWVQCGNRFTTGGVSSSIDGVLKFAEILTGDAQVTKCIQLEIQYNPRPPYATGDPAIADLVTYDIVLGRRPGTCSDGR